MSTVVSEAENERERLAGTSRDPVLRRRNRKLALLLVGICVLMAVCGFVYVRWLMMRSVGTP